MGHSHMFELICNRLSSVQQEDPILKIVMEWISSHEEQDLKHLLRDHITMEEGMVILRKQKKFTYHCTLARELGGNYVVCSPHGSQSGGHEWVP